MTLDERVDAIEARLRLANAHDPTCALVVSARAHAVDNEIGLAACDCWLVT